MIHKQYVPHTKHIDKITQTSTLYTQSYHTHAWTHITHIHRWKHAIHYTKHIQTYHTIMPPYIHIYTNTHRVYQHTLLAHTQHTQVYFADTTCTGSGCFWTWREPPEVGTVGFSWGWHGYFLTRIPALSSLLSPTWCFSRRPWYHSDSVRLLTV